MAYKGREGNVSSLITTITLIAVVISLVVCLSVFGKQESQYVDEYQWITSDTAAEPGMLDGTVYQGEKNASGFLSYKIAEIINTDSQGNGDFKIENSGKNTCLMKVTIKVDDEIIYETGYIKPNQHITSDKLDKIPGTGLFTADVSFEGFDPTSEESIGSTSTQITINVA